MKDYFSLVLVAQIIVAWLFIVHRFIMPLGSDAMFVVLILSILVGGYLIWLSLRNPDTQGFQRILGIILGLLPIFWLVVLIFFVTNFTAHH